jgi:O-antigen ligase
VKDKYRDRLKMINVQEKSFIQAYAQKFFYILFMIYAAFLVIFAKPENEIIANLSGVVLVAFFLFYQLVYTSKTFYINSMLFVYMLFYMLCILSLTWTLDVNYSIYTVTRMAQIFINLLLLYNILKIFKVHEAIFTGLLIGILYNTLLATEILAVAEPIYLKVRFIGTTTHPNSIGLLALFSILGSILLLQNAKNRFWIFINLVNILAAFYIIILAASRSSMVIGALIIGLFILQLFLNKQSRFYLLGFAGVVFVLVVYFVDMHELMDKFNFAMERIAGIFGAFDGHHADSSTAERLSFLHIMIEVFKENPFLGTGVNTSRVFLHGFYSHNNYIEILGTLGLVGLMLYYSAYAHLVWKIFRVKAFWVKYYLFVFIMVILLYDFAAVTFYSKDILMLLLVLHFMAEENSQVA